MASRRLEVLITGDARGAQKAFGDVERAAGGAEKKSGKAVSGIRNKLIGLGAAGLAVGAFKAFDEAQKVGKQTEAVIKSTGGAANKTAKEFGDLADSISRKTGIDDEQIQSSENMLATFTGIRNEVGKGNDIFDQATKAALDMAVAQGQDGVAAAKMLGKALNDPAAGLSKLTRSGVVFTEQQKAQVKALSESGDKLGAQKIILAELNKEFGGSAEAQATSLGKAKVAVDNLAESVGGAMAPALEKAANVAASLADGFSHLPVGAQQATVGITGVGVAAIVAGPKLMEFYRTMSSGASAAVAWGRNMSDAIGSIAATRGVSKTTATVETLKSSMATTPAEFGKFKSGALAAAAGATAFELTLSTLNKAVQFHGDLAGAAKDLDQYSRGVATADEALTEFGGSTKDLADAISTSNGDGLGRRVKDLGKLFSGDLGGGKDILKVKQANSDVKAFDQTLADMANNGNADGAKKVVGQLTVAMAKQGITAKDIAKAFPEYFNAVARAGRESGGAAGKVDKAKKAVSEQDKVVRQSIDPLKRIGARYKVIGDNADYAEKKIHDFYDTQTSNVSSQIQVERSLDDVAQSLKDNGVALSISAEKGRLNREAIIDSTKAAADYAAQLGRTQGPQAAIDAMEQYRLKLDDALIQGGLTRDQVLALNTEMGLTPEDIYTTFGENTKDVQPKVQGYKGEIWTTPTFWNTVFHADTGEAMGKIADLMGNIIGLGSDVIVQGVGSRPQSPRPSYPTPPNQPKGVFPPGKAKGGSVHKGMWNLVGERGPELVKWGASGTVIPAGQTAGMLGGGNTYVTVYVQGSVTTERDLVRSIRDGINRDASIAGRSTRV